MWILRLSYLLIVFLIMIFKELVREFFFCIFGKGEDKSNKLNVVFFFCIFVYLEFLWKYLYFNLIFDKGYMINGSFIRIGERGGFIRGRRGCFS